MIFKKFKYHNVTINLEKSKFFVEKLTFLGHIISPEGISMDPEKVSTIQDFRAPTNKKEFQRFCGFINFYRRFIRGHSELTKSLSDLTKKDNPWEWTTIHQQAFEDIKSTFLKNIVLKYPDFNLPFYICTDASTVAIAAELFQRGPEDEHKPICN